MTKYNHNRRVWRSSAPLKCQQKRSKKKKCEKKDILRDNLSIRLLLAPSYFNTFSIQYIPPSKFFSFSFLHGSCHVPREWYCDRNLDGPRGAVMAARQKEQDGVVGGDGEFAEVSHGWLSRSVLKEVERDGDIRKAPPYRLFCPLKTLFMARSSEWVGRAE